MKYLCKFVFPTCLCQGPEPGVNSTASDAQADVIRFVFLHFWATGNQTRESAAPVWLKHRRRKVRDSGSLKWVGLVEIELLSCCGLCPSGRWNAQPKSLCTIPSKNTISNPVSVQGRLINWKIEFKIPVKRVESCLIICHIINTTSLVILSALVLNIKRGVIIPAIPHIWLCFMSVWLCWSGWGPSFSMVKCFHANLSCLPKWGEASIKDSQPKKIAPVYLQDCLHVPHGYVQMDAFTRIRVTMSGEHCRLGYFKKVISVQRAK